MDTYPSLSFLPFPHAVVIRAVLAPFDCSAREGVMTMDADPSIECWVPNGPHARMLKVAVVMVLLFVVGVPVSFATILVRNRDAIRADQVLRICKTLFAATGAAMGSVGKSIACQFGTATTLTNASASAPMRRS
jgi:hypothetical protein